jgi:multiple sugar transport system permease protein
MQTTNEYNRKRYRLGLWFVAPAVFVLLIVLAYPIFASLVLSFLRVRFAGQGLSFEFNGLNNYADLFRKDLFREALFRSVYYTVIEVVSVI